MTGLKQNIKFCEIFKLLAYSTQGSSIFITFSCKNLISQYINMYFSTGETIGFIGQSPGEFCLFVHVR